jgi:PPOX class probable FMN-dependent enzyme
MIESADALRRLYSEPKERAIKKQLNRLDPHCSRFIAMSPFVVIASGSTGAHMDASPRGGEPGFVKSPDHGTLLIPDASGNNRLDTLTNIIASGKIGLLFFVPGFDETLRVNGTARLRDEPEFLHYFSADKHPPKLVIEVAVAEAYLHCAKAFMRSRLWDGASQVERSVLPSMGEMVADQSGAPPETQEQMLIRYAAEL